MLLHDPSTELGARRGFARATAQRASTLCRFGPAHNTNGADIAPLSGGCSDRMRTTFHRDVDRRSGWMPRQGRSSANSHGVVVVGWPMVLARTMSNECGGTRSTPSGLFRYPGAVPVWPVFPYCQTIRSDLGSMTTTRWLKSSFRRKSPLGRAKASDGWFSCGSPGRGW